MEKRFGIDCSACKSKHVRLKTVFEIIVAKSFSLKGFYNCFHNRLPAGVGRKGDRTCGAVFMGTGEGTVMPVAGPASREPLGAALAERSLCTFCDGKRGATGEDSRDVVFRCVPMFVHLPDAMRTCDEHTCKNVDALSTAVGRSGVNAMAVAACTFIRWTRREEGIK